MEMYQEVVQTLEMKKEVVDQYVKGRESYIERKDGSSESAQIQAMVDKLDLIRAYKTSVLNIDLIKGQ